MPLQARRAQLITFTARIYFVGARNVLWSAKKKEGKTRYKVSIIIWGSGRTYTMSPLDGIKTKRTRQTALHILLVYINIETVTAYTEQTKGTFKQACALPKT